MAAVTSCTESSADSFMRKSAAVGIILILMMQVTGGLKRPPFHSQQTKFSFTLLSVHWWPRGTDPALLPRLLANIKGFKCKVLECNSAVDACETLHMSGEILPFILQT